MRHSIAALVCALPILAATSAGATDLLQAWQAAQQSDPEFAASIAAHQAGETRRAQADALWRPTVQLSAAAGIGSSDSAASGAQFSAPGFGRSDGVAFNTSVANGNMQRWTLSARQPLISRERQAQSRQLDLAAEAAELEWQNARQALMLRVAERYFDAVLAEESLRVLRRQQFAVERALTEVRDRFELGDVKVTDTHEAAARAEAIKAQVLAVETEVEMKQLTLSSLTGLAPGSLRLLVPKGSVPAPAMPGLEAWLEKTRAQNPHLRMQAAASATAKEESAKFSALASPTLDLVAQTGRERLHGSGDFGNASNSGSNSMIGVQLTLPLYTGGWRSSRRAETLHLADQAEAKASRARQQITLQTRAVWLELTVGAARIKALDDASKASRARLDATRLGNQVGDRTTLDLLNAENDAANAELALTQARAGMLLARLKLAALAGELNQAQLEAVNAALQAAEPR